MGRHRKIMETEEQQIGQDSIRQFDEEATLSSPRVEKVDGLKPKSWLDEMQFIPPSALFTTVQFVRNGLALNTQ